jgi:hypothetical protein
MTAPLTPIAGPYHPPRCPVGGTRFRGVRGTVRDYGLTAGPGRSTSPTSQSAWLGRRPGTNGRTGQGRRCRPPAPAGVVRCAPPGLSEDGDGTRVAVLGPRPRGQEADDNLRRPDGQGSQSAPGRVARGNPADRPAPASVGSGRVGAVRRDSVRRQTRVAGPRRVRPRGPAHTGSTKTVQIQAAAPPRMAGRCQFPPASAMEPA